MRSDYAIILSTWTDSGLVHETIHTDVNPEEWTAIDPAASLSPCPDMPVYRRGTFGEV